MTGTVQDYLQARGIAYELKPHLRPALTCETAAEERGVRLSQIVKCMIAQTDGGDLVTLLLPGDRKLKSSKARKWLRAGKVELLPAERLERDHGLVVGAISPVDLLGRATILMDPSVLDEEFVDISSGDPLAGVELLSADLRDLLQAHVVDITSAPAEAAS